MTAVLAILTNTPVWVFLLFVLLVLLGVQSLRPRSILLARVFITPAVFIAWGLANLVLTARATPTAPAVWAVTAALGCMLAFFTLRLSGLSAEPGGRVHLPGSRLPLLRNLLIFAAKYAIGVTLARHPEARPQLLVWDIAISGVSAGYFAGWTARFLLAYRRSAAALLPAASGD